jgi:hypothetical protein
MERVWRFKLVDHYPKLRKASASPDYSWEQTRLRKAREAGNLYHTPRLLTGGGAQVQFGHFNSAKNIFSVSDQSFTFGGQPYPTTDAFEECNARFALQGCQLL